MNVTGKEETGGRGRMSRRHFLGITAAAAAGASLSGCATNPVTGKRQFMLISTQSEISLDQEQSPHQFSQDFGVVQDSELNAYLNAFGQGMAAQTHRPEMPYSFRAVNAVYVNAYAFPGGSIAFTRGILLDLQDEAELAALCGHELGHVNARHAGARISKGMVAQAAILGLAVAIAQKNEDLAGLSAGLGSIGAGALLAHYSRTDERQADDLGMQYMVRSGYDPEGMVGLMELLVQQGEKNPGILELMFSTHPMSSERLQTAEKRAARRNQPGLRRHRERYMDHTVKLRNQKEGLRAFQRGNQAMSKKVYGEAETQYREGLRLLPDDYAGLLLMAQCQMDLERQGVAKEYIDRALAAYPGEARAEKASGVLSLNRGQFAEAHYAFERCAKALPGDPSLFFLNGQALEGMGKKKEAAGAYHAFLQYSDRGKPAQTAYQRLVDWGYIEP